MRHLVAILAILALAVALAVDAPFAEAKKPKSPDAQLLKDAAKAAKRRAKPAAREIKGRGKAAGKVIKSLAKAAKTGRNVEQLSGVPSTSGVKVSDEQRAALSDAFVEELAEFESDVVDVLQQLYAELRGDPDLAALGNSTLPSRLPGSGGTADGVTGVLTDAWRGAGATVDKSARKLQSALRSPGFDVSITSCVPPKLNAPAFGARGDVLFSVHQILHSVATSDGNVSVVVLEPDGPLYTGRDVGVSVLDANGVIEGDLQKTTPADVFVAVWSTVSNSFSGGLHMAGHVDRVSSLVVGGSPAPVSVPELPFNDPGGSTTSTVAFVIDGSSVGNLRVGQALVQPEGKGIDFVRVELNDISTGARVAAISLSADPAVKPKPGKPFRVNWPFVQGRVASVTYTPEGVSGPFYITQAATSTNQLDFTFDGNPANGPTDFTVSGSVDVVSTIESPGTLPCEFVIKIESGIVVNPAE